jgi:hypothetical protein
MGVGDFFGNLGSARPMTESVLERPVRAVKDLSKHLPDPKFLGGVGAASAPVAPKETVDFDLQDMTLPLDVLEVLTPVLGEFNMRMEIAEKKNPVIKTTRMHVAINGGLSVYLLHFNSEVLEDARWASKVMERGWLFHGGDNVRVLSKGCQDPDPSFEFAWRTWSEQGISTEYVEWRRIERLRRLQEEERADLLHVALRLPGTVRRRSPSSAPARLLDDTDRFGALTVLVASIGATTGTDVSAFVNNLLIGVLPPEMRAERNEWGNSYQAAAREVLQWAASKGKHPNRDGYSCLAAVLVTFLDGQGSEGRTLIVETLQRYQLITADRELASIRAKYL